MSKRSIRNLELAGRRVLIRVDFNVPLAGGEVGDDTRIRAALPTVRYALERGATVVLASHLGRPKGTPRPDLSLRPVARHLSELLDRPVHFAADCIGEPARAAIVEAHPGGIALLENLRFHAGEERDDAALAAELGALADVYVNDAFGAAHRAHASTAGIVSHVGDAGAGLLLGAELEHLGALLGNPRRPFVAVLGGAKVSGKLDVIENLLGRVDALLIGGAMAYTFFERRGLPVGRSLVEPDLLDAADRVERDARGAGVDLRLPADHVVTERIEAGAATATLSVDDAAIGDRIGVDIGPRTRQSYAEVVGRAGTVVWNGPLGVFEIDAFAAGTLAMARAVAGTAATTVVGGGDSVAAVGKAGVRDRITHISTGGGASLEFLAGRTLPGVSALPDA